MDTYKHRYLEFKSRWLEYSKLQEQLRKDRRVIHITSCLACLLIGFVVGMLVFSRQEFVVNTESPESRSEVKSELISL